MHPEITKEDYKSFAETYYGSPEERQDLIQYYEEFEGDMTKILEFIMCSRNEDLPRFIEFFDSQIASKELVEYPAYKRTKGKVDMMPDEKAEAKQAKQKLKKKQESSMADLQKMILAKRQ